MYSRGGRGAEGAERSGRGARQDGSASSARQEARVRRLRARGGALRCCFIDSDLASVDPPGVTPRYASGTNCVPQQSAKSVSDG